MTPAATPPQTPLDSRCVSGVYWRGSWIGFMESRGGDIVNAPANLIGEDLERWKLKNGVRQYIGAVPSAPPAMLERGKRMYKANGGMR